jgi:hypothetical protein
MSFGYIGDTSTSVKQQVKNKGILTTQESFDLERQGFLGGSLELLQEVNASGTSSIEFTSIQEEIFDVHFMTLSLDCTGGSGATFYTLQFFEDGIGYETASVYQFALQDGKTSGTFAETNTTSTSSLSVAFFSGLTSPTINSYQYFYNLGNSSKYSFQTMHSFSDDNTADGFRFGGGVLPQASKVTGIKLLANGTTTSTGTVKLFGLKQI